jgi:tryptophan synthase alpha chain
MSAIERAFARVAAEKRSAFIPFLMGGDPTPELGAELLVALAEGGADLIEVGVPFSDPIADGPTNQRAAGRALAAGIDLAKVLSMIAEARERIDAPIVLFTYFNPIHVRGVERFAERARSSGVDGVLCVDLPPEEAEAEVLPAFAAHDLDPIFLLSPTSSVERMKKVAAVSSGFVYYVSRTGVTGEQSELSASLAREVKTVRKKVSLPVAVGFGISSPEQVAEVADVADGVVVGSHLVRMVEDAATSGDFSDLPARLERRVRELSAPLRPESRRRRA